MVLLHTPEKQDNFTAPDFKLLDCDGSHKTLADVRGENGTLIMFICNHCPYVIAIIDRIVETAQELENRRIGCAAIMSNDTQAYPADSFDNMKIFGKQHGLTFPYLIDETQKTAKAYNAVCTPDFFGFDAQDKLIYRGRLDSASNKPADKNTIPELLNALTGKSAEPQKPSMGCSIKWKS